MASLANVADVGASKLVLLQGAVHEFWFVTLTFHAASHAHGLLGMSVAPAGAFHVCARARLSS